MKLRRALGKAKLDVELLEASDADEALAIVKSTRVDCVLLDYLLPTMTGAELLRQLADLGPSFDAAVIGLTGIGDESVAVELMKAGTADYIPKHSLTPERLALSVRAALSLRRAEQAARRARSEHRRYVVALRALTEAAPRVHGTLDRDRLLSVAAFEACRVLGAQRAEIASTPPGGPVSSAVAAIDGAARALPAPPWDEMRRQSFEARAPQRFYFAPADAETPSRRDADLEKSHLRPASSRVARAEAALSVPLLGRMGEIVGVMSVVGLPDGEVRDADEAVASQLGQMVAVALENVRLHESAREAARACDEMRAIVCHDLRNPLGSIQLGTTLLREMVPDDVETDAVLTRMDVAMTHMQRLIGDLLESARIVEKGLVVAPTAIPADELLTAAQTIAAGQAAAAHVNLEATGGDLVGAVRGERDRVLQVLSNLVGNAIKYTPSGGTVRIEAAREGDLARFTVRDPGPGIPSEQVPHVFDMFWQSGDPTSRRGIGLGLYIARSIVEAHGGRIWVETQPGAGTAFHFTLAAA